MRVAPSSMASTGKSPFAIQRSSAWTLPSEQAGGDALANERANQLHERRLDHRKGAAHALGHLAPFDAERDG